ncbi:unnamed protein product [Ectocarpus sp. CCAP 1310/34]|nr:unnamed protein product [Ectocarpus sp. CCAP 1310/34]
MQSGGARGETPPGGPSKPRETNSRGGGGGSGHSNAASNDTEDGEPASTPRVFSPALAHLGSNSASTSVEAPQVSIHVPPKRYSKVDVYALNAAAQGDRGQSQVNVYDLLHASDETQGPVPKAVYLAATRAVAALRDREAGIRVLSLFKALVFTYVWLRNIAEDEPGMLEIGATGWTLRMPSHGVVPVGTIAESVDAVSTGDAEKHLREVLLVARGTRNGKGACLLDWLNAGGFVDGDTSTLNATQVDGLHAYAAAKTKFMADGVQPIGEKERKIAESAICCGTGLCGDGVYSIMALQIALAVDVPPHESAENFKVAGYDCVWQDNTFDDMSSEHVKYKMWQSGIFVGPDGPHAKNRSKECQRQYSGFTTCDELAGINLNPPEQDHSKKALYLRSLNTMTFSGFTFALRVLNERQNQGCNRKTLRTHLPSVTEHAKDIFASCEVALWRYGRCFCRKPVMRVFDCLGRVDIVMLATMLGSTA